MCRADSHEPGGEGVPEVDGGASIGKTRDEPARYCRAAHRAETDPARGQQADDWMRTRLGLLRGQLAAIAVVHTVGDYIGFHPHLHILAADGLIDAANRFHLTPDETIAPLAEIFRRRIATETGSVSRNALSPGRRAGNPAPRSG